MKNFPRIFGLSSIWLFISLLMVSGVEFKEKLPFIQKFIMIQLGIGGIILLVAFLLLCIFMATENKWPWD